MKKVYIAEDGTIFDTMLGRLHYECNVALFDENGETTDSLIDACAMFIGKFSKYIFEYFEDEASDIDYDRPGWYYYDEEVRAFRFIEENIVNALNNISKHILKEYKTN